jgi:hypothetical protein
VGIGHCGMGCWQVGYLYTSACINSTGQSLCSRSMAYVGDEPSARARTGIASHRIASHRIASHRIASHRHRTGIASHRIASHRTGIAPALHRTGIASHRHRIARSLA